MDKKILENINELFDSSDLFKTGMGFERIRDNLRKITPALTEIEIRELEDYLHRFYDFCCHYADRLAKKYKTTSILWNDEAKKEVGQYVKLCRQRYPEIDEEHIRSVFSTYCWLSNR